MARTRKDRKKPNPPGDGITVSEIPLSTPDYASKRDPGSPTLLDVIERKRPRHADGTPVGEAEDVDVAIGPAMVSFCFAVPLTMALFCFDVLVHRQYRQELELRLIVERCLKSFPVIWFIQYLFHPRRSWLSVRLFLLSMSIAVGCWLVHAVNRKGYYAVMKRAPPMATLWIWAAVELDVLFAFLGCIAVAFYTWYKGFGIM